ncbi:hypothetical protein DM01DRAFT_1339928 [Hesseltinella vesiculosa]|uniref:Uncharacterized protein n=1 Tax=Hesseltinella vesiculosa TaxID=101127 RepID=A0A1X2G5N8_9FUNG|nr:hypothetical protein DM01DRAFT_1339928 [Hesseltinella vesiculosa]
MNIATNTDTLPCTSIPTVVPDFTTTDSPDLSRLTADLLVSTYPYTGLVYLEHLAEHLLSTTQASTVWIQQLVSTEEAENIARRLQTQPTTDVTLLTRDDTSNQDLQYLQYLRCLAPDDINSSSSTCSSSSSSSSSTSASPYAYQYLYTRACFKSNQLDNTSWESRHILSMELMKDTPQSKALEAGLVEGTNTMTIHGSAELPLTVPRSVVSIRLSLSTGQPLGLLTVYADQIRDVSWLRRAQHLLLAVQERAALELDNVRDKERLTMAKNAALQDAENKIKFLADMSHEIRTPMNAVIALTDLLLQERSSLNLEQIEHLEVIQTSGHHLLTVINDILDITKVNQDPEFKLEQRRFCLRKCIKDALNMARHQASTTQLGKMMYIVEYPMAMDDHISVQQTIANLGLTSRVHSRDKIVLPLIWYVEPDVPDHLMGDTMRLTQIIVNLCSNAVKFTKTGGIRVHVKRYVPTPMQQHHSRGTSKLKQRYEAKLEDMYTRAMQQQQGRDVDLVDMDIDDPANSNTERAILEFSVTDTGIGIPPDRLPKLFKSFSQIDISTARRYGGTGLGLAISSTLANRMGGGLWVESEENIGSKFALTIPLSVAYGRYERSYGSESTTASSLMISPPSPTSSASDGGGSVHSGYFERTAIDSYNTNTSAGGHSLASPASLTGATTPYFQNTSTTSPQQPFMYARNRQPASWCTYNPRRSSSSLDYHPATSVEQPCSSQQQPTMHPLITSLPASTLPSPTQVFASVLPPSSAGQLFTSAPIPTATESKPIRPLLRRGEASPSLLNHPPTATGAKRTNSRRHRPKLSTSQTEDTSQPLPIKIILAEDNILNQKIAVSILKRLGYQDVTVVNNGKEVLERMRSQMFDVIFMDLYMPEMDGLEATKEIVNQRTSAILDPASATLKNVQDIYIIALTASASQQDRQICIDAGMNDFIGKPFTMQEMKNSLQTCSRKLVKVKDPAEDMTME